MSIQTMSNRKLRKFFSPIPFILIHLAVLCAMFTGVEGRDFIILGVIYASNMFAITAGYHRYFSHRTYKTGRTFQFILAFLAQVSIQKGVLWWAAHHRMHHKYSDTEHDVHSPVQRGFWYAHIGWIVDIDNDETRFSKVRDLARFPELRFLNRFYLLPPILTGLVVFLAWGSSALLLGFFGATLLSWHVTFCINSLAHVWGTRTYETTDDSRNNWWLALLSFGEGWHNNHHHDMMSTRQGFRWWQVDVSFYVLWLLARVGVVWDLRGPGQIKATKKSAVRIPGGVRLQPSLNKIKPPQEGLPKAS